LSRLLMSELCSPDSSFCDFGLSRKDIFMSLTRISHWINRTALWLEIRERQSPDWRPAKLQSGDRRSRATVDRPENSAIQNTAHFAP
jgi:hypothetical protein